MLGISEVDVAKSVDDLLTSQSVEVHEFPDFETLDAEIASALKRSITNQYFRRRINVEEQHAHEYNRFLRGRQIACIIYQHFRAIGAHEAALDISDLFNVSLQGDDIQDFETRWDQALLSASEVAKENVLESLCKMKICESVQVQTVFAMYDQDIDRESSSAKLSKIEEDIDHLIRTRNFRARNERMQKPRRQECQCGKENGRMLSVESEWTVFKRRLLQFSHGNTRGQKARSTSLAPKTQTQTDGRKPTEGFGSW